MRPTHILFLNDDIPSLGSGWRGVVLRNVGRKWVHLYAAASGDAFKVPLDKWEDLVKAASRRLARSGLDVEYSKRKTRFRHV